MKPDRNMQIILASLGKLTSTTSPDRKLLVVPAWKNGLSSFKLPQKGSMAVPAFVQSYSQSQARLVFVTTLGMDNF